MLSSLMALYGDKRIVDEGNDPKNSSLSFIVGVVVIFSLREGHVYGYPHFSEYSNMRHAGYVSTVMYSKLMR